MKELQLAGGLIRYRDQGLGEAVVFLHGALINGATWRKVIPDLSQRYRCIAPDLPLGGHNAPFDADLDLSPTGIAMLLKQFLDRLGLARVVLVGNDTGGAYAQIFTALFPEKVSRLVLSNCDALEVFPPRHFATLPHTVRIPGAMSVMAALFRIKPFLKTSMVLGLLSHNLSGDEIYRLYSRHFVQNPHTRRDFRKVAMGWSSEYTQEAARALAHFVGPVLLIWGSDDKLLFPLELGSRLRDVFPNARLESIEGALTYVQEDQPQWFAERLDHFLKRTANEAAATMSDATDATAGAQCAPRVDETAQAPGSSRATRIAH